jgi:hypothetical protein
MCRGLALGDHTLKAIGDKWAGDWNKPPKQSATPRMRFSTKGNVVRPDNLQGRKHKHKRKVQPQETRETAVQALTGSRKKA